MSFRIKTTHKLLEPNVPLDKRPDVSSLYDENGDLKPFKMADSVVENRPTAGSAKGLAIRVVKSADADHM